MISSSELDSSQSRSRRPVAVSPRLDELSNVGVDDESSWTPDVPATERQFDDSLNAESGDENEDFADESGLEVDVRMFEVTSARVQVGVHSSSSDMQKTPSVRSIALGLRRTTTTTANDHDRVCS